MLKYNFKAENIHKLKLLCYQLPLLICLSNTSYTFQHKILIKKGITLHLEKKKNLKNFYDIHESYSLHGEDKTIISLCNFPLSPNYSIS